MDVHHLIGNGVKVLIVFESKMDAYACMNACAAHERRRPIFDDFDDIDEAERATERWRKRHPGGRDAWTCDEFGVATRTVRRAKHG